MANLSRPVSLSVFTSKVRISIAPPISSVTTTRSPATVLEVTRAPFGRRDNRVDGRCGASAGVENAIADDTDHSGERDQGG